MKNHLLFFLVVQGNNRISVRAAVLRIYIRPLHRGMCKPISVRLQNLYTCGDCGTHFMFPFLISEAIFPQESECNSFLNNEEKNLTLYLISEVPAPLKFMNSSS